MIVNNYQIGQQYDLEIIKQTNYESLQQNPFGQREELYTYFGKNIEPFDYEYLNFFYNQLEDSIETMAFEERYRYKPAYISIEKYNTARLAHLILFINNVFHPADFYEENLDYVIKYPEPEALITISKQMNSVGRIKNINIENSRIFV